MQRLAAPSDLPGIITLWQDAFGDSPEAVTHFFHTFGDCISYVTEQDGQIVSMVHALPQTLHPDIPDAYIYAVATAAAYQGQGHCRKLMRFAEDDLKSRGFSCCVLTPGEPSLFRFYQAMGYEAAFTRNRTVFTAGTPISAEQYALRREQLLTLPHIRCDLRTLSYAADLYGLTFYETTAGIAAASPSYTAEMLPEDLGGTAFAMVKWLDKPHPLQNAYLGFALE